MDAKTLFDEKLPAILTKAPDKAREIDAIYVFNITGDNGGMWTVDLKSDPPFVKQGDEGTSECTIEVSDEDFSSILKDPQQGMQLFFQGKLKVTGNPMLATKIQEVFKLG